MLDGKELAKRLKAAMQARTPPVTGAELATACGVTPQAVSGWLHTGRLHKRHLQTIAELTKKPLEYFLLPGVHADTKKSSNGSKKNSTLHNETIYDEHEFLVVFRAWQDADKNGRGALLGLANALRRAHAVRKKHSP